MGHARAGLDRRRILDPRDQQVIRRIVLAAFTQISDASASSP
jgi:hypothetical protein